jgi:hypothetical protein
LISQLRGIKCVGNVAVTRHMINVALTRHMINVALNRHMINLNEISAGNPERKT